MQLYNKYDKRLLEAQLADSDVERITFSFYQYHQIKDPQALRDQLYLEWSAIGLLGRIYIAQEGINGQASIPKNSFTSFRDSLEPYTFMNNMRLNIAIEDDGKSFIKLKILVRNKILADGLDDSTFNPSDTGVHLDAEEFNKLTDDERTILIDMRNHYESEVGHIQNAITPDVDTFRDSLPVIEEMLKGNEDKNIVMYCTGGIRCEKASAWFKHKGFKNVHQLNGGIIEYARQVKKYGLENKFIGKNFVFDKRLGERISDDVIAVCHQCGNSCDRHVNCKNEACHLLFIQCEECAEKLNDCCSEHCKDFISLPLAEQKEKRKGKPARNVYKKGRSPHLIYKK